jgi:hypothetical protein
MFDGWTEGRRRAGVPPLHAFNDLIIFFLKILSGVGVLRLQNKALFAFHTDHATVSVGWCDINFLCSSQFAHKDENGVLLSFQKKKRRQNFCWTS